ncbi:hypothetical protein ACIRO1_45295 [Streptomyces sp. NPDC102381]|jgi:hypothetical protein|uniref:hypothetical protein n=1 Tax=Streptomyces sp. NPDC102381 TaxID=3366164 RepID=UPI00382B6568
MNKAKPTLIERGVALAAATFGALIGMVAVNFGTDPFNATAVGFLAYAAVVVAAPYKVAHLNRWMVVRSTTRTVLIAAVITGIFVVGISRSAKGLM